MSLRPRYSLLTLLILTALVAGGVKLWYGPHHVVLQTKPDQEDEYTYTRGWPGEKIVHGPQVIRFHYYEYRPFQVCITYNRHGKVLPVAYWFLPYATSARTYPLKLENNPLTPEEQEEFCRAIDQERRRLHDHGLTGDFLEGYDPCPSLNISDPKADKPPAKSAPSAG